MHEMPTHPDLGKASYDDHASTNLGSEDDLEKLALRTTASLRLLIENLQDVAIFTMDLEGRCVSLNRGAESILGYTESEMWGQFVGIIFTPEDRANGVDLAELQTARQQGQAQDDRWHVRKDGSRFMADGMMTLLRDDLGHPYGFAKILRDLTQQRQADEALQQSHIKLDRWMQEQTSQLAVTDDARRVLIRKLVTSQEEERARLARELHDQTGQQLTALIFGLKGLTQPGIALQDEINRLVLETRNLMDELHTIAASLRPPAMDLFGLDAALEEYCQKWTGWSGIPVEFNHVGLEGCRFPLEIETTVYRVVQEALTNVMRHGGGTTQVQIEIVCEENQLDATIKDDGSGFDATALLKLPPAQRRLGLLGMQERAALVEGSLTIESQIGRGTVIHLRVPVLTDAAVN